MSRLAEFCAAHCIDMSKVRRARRTAILVGVYGTAPGLYALTNRPLTPEYCELFDGVGELSFDAAVRLFKPTFDLYPHHSGRYLLPVYDLPRDGEAPLARTPMTAAHPLLSEARPEAAAPGRAPAAAGHPGREAFRKATAALTRWADVQASHPEVLGRLAALFKSCSLERGLPAFDVGADWPGGLAEEAIDFLYADPPRPFPADRLAFEGRLWGGLKGNQGAAGRQALADVVGAFREAMTGTADIQFNAVTFKGKPLPELAAEALAGHEALVEKFRAARAGRAEVRQLLLDTPRLAGMLEWVLDDIYARVEPSFEPDDTPWDRHEKVLRAVQEGSYGLPKAVKRLNRDQRRQFEKMLTDGWQRLVRAVTAADDAYAAMAPGLDDELKDLADRIRADGARSGVIALISGAASGADILEAFIKGNSTMLIDVLVPALCRLPVLTIRGIKESLKAHLLALYFTAVALDARNESAVRRIAASRVGEFEKEIENFAAPTQSTRRFVAQLLDEYLNLLGRPEMKDRLAGAVRVIREVLALQEKADEAEARRLFDAIWPDGLTRRSAPALKRVRPEVSQLRALLHGVIRPRVKERFADRHAELAGAAAGAQAGAAASRRAHPAGPSPAARKANAKANGKSNGKQAAGPEKDAGAPALPPPEYLTAIESAVDARVDALFAAGAPGEGAEEKVAAEAEAELWADQNFAGGLVRDFEAFSKVVALIYARFSDPENSTKKAFCRQTLKMSFQNLLLTFKGDLLLGKDNSNLYMLLGDLIEAVDGDNPAVRDFTGSRSITEYLEDVSDGGLVELRDALVIAGVQSRQNLSGYVGELVGLKYVCDKLAGSPDAELIVHVTTARGFLNHFQDDSLTANAGRGLYRLGKWQSANGASEASLAAGAVYFSDAAFPQGDKLAWLSGLRGLKLHDPASGFSALLPPVLVGTGPQSSDYAREGAALEAAARGAPVAVHVAGPAVSVPGAAGAPPVVIGAGYAAVAHLLGAGEQRLTVPNAPRPKPGRFHTLGYGSAGFRKSLERFLMGDARLLPAAPRAATEGDSAEPPAESLPLSAIFEGDFYLYLVLAILGTAKYGGGGQPVDATGFYELFHTRHDDPNTRFVYRASAALGPALHCGDAFRFALEQALKEGQPLTGLTVALAPGPNLESDGPRRRTMTDVAWFNDCRTAAEID
jgi:hypothetical protein